jgi:uncharacterized protein
MKKLITLMLPVSLVAAVGLIIAQDKPAEKKTAKPEEVEKVKAILTFEPQAKPKKLHNILVFSKTNGFRHSSIELAAKAMELMGASTKVFKTTHTEDESAFEAENLKQYDGIIFANTTGEVFRPSKDMPADEAEKAKVKEREAKLKQNLLDFVNNGGGLIGFHSATDTYANWDEYKQMMGGTFGGHPWHEDVGVKNVDPDNATTKAFGGKDFRIKDEIYQWKPGSFSSDTHRIVLAMDNKTTNMDKKNKEGKDTTNGLNAVYPITVMRKYGKGRVFYCSLGHREEIFWNPQVMQHYLAGIQYAVGDLEANDAPKNVGAEWPAN